MSQLKIHEDWKVFGPVTHIGIYDTDLNSFEPNFGVAFKQAGCNGTKLAYEKIKLQGKNLMVCWPIDCTCQRPSRLLA